MHTYFSSSSRKGGEGEGREIGREGEGWGGGEGRARRGGVEEKVG